MDLIETFSIIFRRVVVFVEIFVYILWCTNKIGTWTNPKSNVADAINRDRLKVIFSC